MSSCTIPKLHMCVVISIHTYDCYKRGSEYLAKVTTHIIILLGGNRSKMGCTTRTTQEIIGSSLSLFLKCCPTPNRASKTEMSGLLQFEIPGSKTATYIYFTVFQWILLNTVGLPWKDVRKPCISLCSGLPLNYYTEVIMDFMGFRKWQAIIKHYQRY